MVSKFVPGDWSKSLVHVASHGGEIMRVVDLERDGPTPRYSLVSIDGVSYSNIGEYELTLATADEVDAALDARGK